MRFGEALEVLHAGVSVRRANWDDGPERLCIADRLTLVSGDGGCAISWYELGNDQSVLTYEDLDNDDWQPEEPIGFGTALKLAWSGLKVRRPYWPPNRHLDPKDPSLLGQDYISLSRTGIGEYTYEDLSATDWEVSDE